MKVGIVSFGAHDHYPVADIVAGYKSFYETNTPLKLDITISYQPTLPISEFDYDSTNNCYFLSPYSMSASTKSLFPSGQDIIIALWNPGNCCYQWSNAPCDYSDKCCNHVCFGGATWGTGAPVAGAPFISIGFAWNNVPWGTWQNSYSQSLTHETIHVLGAKLHDRGYPELPNVDNCGAYGFSCQCDQFGVSNNCCSPLNCNDDGWQNCFKYIFSKITPEMWQAIEPAPTPSSQCTRPCTTDEICLSSIGLDCVKRKDLYAGGGVLGLTFLVILLDI